MDDVLSDLIQSESRPLISAANHPHQRSGECLNTHLNFEVWDGLTYASQNPIQTADSFNAHAGGSHVLDFAARPHGAHHPDELSTGGVSTFFDFEAWSGDGHRSDHAIEAPFASNIRGCHPIYSSEGHHIFRQADHGQLLFAMPSIEPGLSPYADGILSKMSELNHTHAANPEHALLDTNVFANVDAGPDGSVQPTATDVYPTASSELEEIFELDTAVRHLDIEENRHQPMRIHLEMFQETPQSSRAEISTEKEKNKNMNKKKKKKRTAISDAAKMILNAQFGINPYPNSLETSELEGKTSLPGSTIKTWFSNTRSRTQATAVPAQQRSSVGDQRGNRSPLAYQEATQDVSRNSLDALEKVSPAASMHSLQRYLAMPASEEAVSFEAIEAARRGSGDELFGREEDDENGGIHIRDSIPQAQLAMERFGTRSVAGSESSRDSARSYTSQGSFKSVDSRGSRRGRKQWLRGQSFGASSLGIQASQSSDSRKEEAITPSIFCTWPSCNATFNSPFAWRRHEEAVHYQPYHYVCCLENTYDHPLEKCFVCWRANVTVRHVVTEHLSSCTCKSRSDRTFYRKDQLVQHVSGFHGIPGFKSRHGQRLLALWVVPSIEDLSPALKCGICGQTFRTWKDRQDHVYEHLKAGVCKSAWWPDRLPMPREASLESILGKVTCNNCGYECGSIEDAVKYHPNCTAWSCGFLHDIHDSFISFTSRSPQNVMRDSTTLCKLCDFSAHYQPSDEHHHRELLELHAQSHHLRSCSQDRFVNATMLAAHLVAEHGATRTLDSERLLQAWECRSWLIARKSTKVVTAYTSQTYEHNTLCESTIDHVNFGYMPW